MLKLRSLFVQALVVFLPALLVAELPLPDATFYGQIKTPAGTPVGTGALAGRVARGGATVLTTSGVFMAAEGEVWYAIRVPLETAIGAPGPSGIAAREGDVIAALLLNGKPLELKSVPPALAAGKVSRVDATATDFTPPGTLYFRGDCSPDLKLSITDPVRVLNYLFISSEEPPCLAACDADATGTLNLTDAVYLLSFLFLGGPAPPVPGPQCGTDPNPSELGCAQTSCAL